MNYKKKNIKVVILASSRDFGRCPVATRLPQALWPVAGRAALEKLLADLANQGLGEVTVYSNGDWSVLQKSIKAFSGLKVNFLDEPLPVGTAGAIRDACRDAKDDLILVLPANIVNPPAIDALINTHSAGKADLTVMFDPADSSGKVLGRAVDIYVCDPSVLRYIPEDGFFDIKEGLIPALVQADRTIQAAVLPRCVGVFRDRGEYLNAIGNSLVYAGDMGGVFKLIRHNGNQAIWKSGDVTIDPQARIHGPVAVMDGAHIWANAIIFGPTLIGRNVTVGEGTLVANSVLWDGVQIGRDCRINRCVFDYNTKVKNETCVEEKAVAFEPEKIVSKAIRRASQSIGEIASRTIQAIEQGLKWVSAKTPIGQNYGKKGITFGLGAVLVMLALLWSYWPGLIDLWRIWQGSDEYSSGLLVPLLALYILWSRRDAIAGAPVKPCLWGVPAFVLAQSVRFFGLFFMYGSAERLSMVLSIAALVLMLFGWQLFKKVATLLLYLCLMLPWPNRVQAAVALPMQRWATSSAVFCLEMLGYAVVREGNIIHIGQASVAVAEACNGLRMVMAFFVVTGLVVLLVKRAWWEKLIVLTSSLPIALLCNTIRLTVTAIAFTFVSGDNWERIFHDFGGYVMMPMALAAVVGELWLITKLTTVSEGSTPAVIARKVRT